MGTGRAAAAAAHTARNKGRAVALALLAALACPAGAGAAAAADARDVAASVRFGAVRTPSPGRAKAIGEHTRGCIAGAVALPADGEHFQAMRLSRNRNYGHPDLVAFVEALAAHAPSLGLDGLLVGDLSQPRGGPMLWGHASHQSGLDVDIWFTQMPTPRLSRQAREAMPLASMLAEDGQGVDEARFTGPWRRLLRRAARDGRVARIFVHPLIKRALCDWKGAGTADARAWLSRIRPWHGHDAHFHVRLACPADDGACVDQAPPPEGDGCGAALEAWFAGAPRKAARPAGERRPLTLSRMPAQCRALVDERPLLRAR